MSYLYSFLAFLVTWAALFLPGFLILSIGFRRKQHTILAGLVAVLISVILLKLVPDFEFSVGMIPTYLIVGLFTSFWTYKTILDRIKEELNRTLRAELELPSHVSRRSVDKLRDAAIEKASIENHISEISFAILVWPVELATLILDDLVDRVTKKIVSAFKAIYNAILKQAFKGI